MKEWELRKPKQCHKCPWKVGVNPYEIPNGYDVNNHRLLKNTISDPDKKTLGDIVNVMACHESALNVENEELDICVGWLNHQLGRGNNITLRYQFIHCKNRKDIEVFGEQHLKFEDTLPPD